MYILTLVLLVSPFFLNDFANIFIKDWRLWLLVDYAGGKVFPFVVMLWLIRSKKMRPAEFGITPQGIPAFCCVFLSMTVAGTVIDQNGYQLLKTLPGYPHLAAYL